jgi:hypothetical protein
LRSLSAEIPGDVRVMFTAYLVVTVTGLAVYIAIGLLHR